MQWLTAILAFATTMLVFAIIVSTIVETIHRVLGNRTDSLAKMLTHYYDEVLLPYMRKPGIGQPEIAQSDFLVLMRGVRGPAVVAASKQADIESGDVTKTKNSMSDNFQKLTNLPVLTFMERLGGSTFASALSEDKIGEGNKDAVLKDIAQKFESYGHESAIHFERKARLKSVIIAFFVAWVFYVHPQNLIQTYLENPEVAAKVAEMNEEALKNHEEVEKLLEALEKGNVVSDKNLTPEQLEKLVKDIKSKLEEGKKKVDLLVDAGAPIGWPERHLAGCLIEDKGGSWTVKWEEVNPELSTGGEKVSHCENKFQLLLPHDLKSLFWLVMGGLLIGLGAPFWAKAISQIKDAQGKMTGITEILKPGQIQVSSRGEVVVSSDTDEKPVTSEAYEVAEAATETVIVATMNAWVNANKMANSEEE